MRPGLLLLVIVVSVGAIGYLEIRHQAAREAWRAEATRLTGRLERAERLAEERADALAAAQQHDRDGDRAERELRDLEARILDATAELAMLESDRTVARERAENAVADLKEQVKALSTIEMDMAALDTKRRRLERHVDTVETRLRQAEVGAAERQRHSEALDRDIAGLAIRRETLQAKLQMAERTLAKTALTAVASQPDEADHASSPDAEIARSEPIVAAETRPALDLEEIEDGDRSRGLYRFGSLPASPEAVDGGQDGLPPTTDGRSDRTDEKAEATSWAEDQYAMGLRLLASAEESSGTRELSDAILAFKAVLGEWPKERDRMRWAIAQSDLGYALALLGKRERRVGVLEQAAAAGRSALAEFRRDETPLLWAAAQHHLGVSLGGLAAMRDDVDLHQASIEALELAIAAFKKAGADADARKAESRLREAYAHLPTALNEPAGEAEP